MYGFGCSYREQPGRVLARPTNRSGFRALRVRLPTFVSPKGLLTRQVTLGLAAHPETRSAKAVFGGRKGLFAPSDAPMPTPTAPGLSTRRLRRRGYLADTRTDVAQAPRSPGRNVRSRCRCSVFVCPAFCTTSRSWLRSSSTHEPSDPPHRAVFVSTSLKRRSSVLFSLPGSVQCV